MEAPADLTGPGAAAPRPRRWRALFQATVGVGALALVLSRTDLSQLGRTLASVNVTPLALAILLNLFMTFLMALRWRLLIAVKYPGVAVKALFQQYLVGQFFNLFTPGAVGGDLARLVAIGKLTGDRAFIFTTLVVERMVGLLGVLLGGIAGVYIGRGYLDHPGTYYGIALLMLAALGAASVMLSARVSGMIVKIVKALEARLGRAFVSGTLEQASAHFALFGRARATVMITLLCTFAVRLVWVFSCWLVAAALSLPVPFSLLLAFISIVDIARMAPISLSNGLGVREYLLVVLLGQLGVPAAGALLFSLIAYTLLTVNGLIGGLIFTTRSASQR